MTRPEYILTLSCLDQRGLVHRVSGFLADHGCNIIDSAQFGDAESRLFFMRVHCVLEESGIKPAEPGIVWRWLWRARSIAISNGMLQLCRK